MVEDKPDDFVESPEEFNQLLALLLDPKREEPIAITAALRGAGGYGGGMDDWVRCINRMVKMANPL